MLLIYHGIILSINYHGIISIANLYDYFMLLILLIAGHAIL